MSIFISMSTLDANALDKLTKRQLIALATPHIMLSRHAISRKEYLINHILTHAPLELQESYLRAIADEQSEKVEKAKASKRKRVDEQFIRRFRIQSNNIAQSHNKEKYMDLPSEEQVKECHREFFFATSNASVESQVCGVCAREVNRIEDGVERMDLQDVPNSARLVPKNPHPAHDLYMGKLLDPEGVSVGEGGRMDVNICRSCRKDLEKDADMPPKFSLANGMWIGSIPDQLRALTFPEQLLVAQLYPRCFVFKLFPKNIHAGLDRDALQRGMRGTVSSYDLNTQDVVSMVEGHLFPRRPAILASLVSVTFIGLGKLSKDWLRTTFRVRRQYVYEALQWLKEHNRYYRDIEISTERLSELPENDVPVELMGIVRQSTDTGIVLEESRGYVPTEDEDLGECILGYWTLCWKFDETVSCRSHSHGRC